METQLDQLLLAMKTKYQHNTRHNSRMYMEVDLGKEAAEMGLDDLSDKLSRVNALIPLKHAVQGMKVRIDGRTFINYVQFDSGITLPGFIAADTRLPHKRYVPWDSMICNFA